MTFSFIHITDHHLAESEAALVHGFSPAQAFRAVMRHIAEHAATSADFIVTTGDLVESASDLAYCNLSHMLDLHDDQTEAPGPLRISLEGLRDFPLYCLPGNHDDRPRFFQYLFPKTPATPLMNVAITHKGVQFVYLDWGPQAKAISYSATLDLLAQSLRTDLPSVILMHHHVVAIGSRWLDDFMADDVDRFWEIVIGHNVLGIFCGHAHITYERVVENIPVFGLRSTALPFALQDDPLVCLLPPQYRFVTIHNSVLTTRVFEVPL
jgi:3',5'-cyclic-AMP phosphodiesterase